MFAEPCKWYNKKMAREQKRVSDKQVVRAGAIIISSANQELVWMDPKSIIVSDDSKFTYDKYLGGYPFGIFSRDKDDNQDPDPDRGDTVELSDIEEITYEPYYSTTKELKYRAILKIRNSSDSKEDVIGVDARTANLEAQA